MNKANYKKKVKLLEIILEIENIEKNKVKGVKMKF